MVHTHTNTIDRAKRLTALALTIALLVSHAGRAHAITYDSAAGEYFDTIDDNGLAGGSAHITMRFGSTLGEFLRFNQSLGKFVLSDDLDVGGTISGALVTQNGAGTNYMRGNLGIGQTAADARLDVLGTVSGTGLQVNGTSILTGNVGIGPRSTTTKARLSVNGTLSGVTVYATKSFSGAGLTDCDNATSSKLLWDATTGRFSCGTDQSGGSSGGGLAISDADKRYVNAHGDTMTGKLLLQNTSIQASSGTFLGLDSNNDVVLTVKGGSMNMTDLQQWRDASDTLLVNVGSDGTIMGNGNLVINGSNITLGDSDSDNVSINGDVVSNLNPEYDSMQYLGNWSSRWLGYFYTADVSNHLNVGGSASVSSDLYVGGNVNAGNVTGGNVTVQNVTNCNSGYHLATDSSGVVYCEADGGGSSSSSLPSYVYDMNQYVNTSSNVQFYNLTLGGVTNCNSGYHLVTDGYGNVYCEYGSAGSSSSSGYFGITDGSTTEYIYDYENISFSDGQNINVSVSSTDTVTISTTDNVSFSNLNVSGNSTFGDNVGDRVNVSAGNWTFNTSPIFTMNGGPLRIRGTLSGVTLYATRSFSGAGLTDCDNATSSKLLWDATTGRFSCGTDQSGGSSGGGLAISDADKRYVNAHGDTMTGKLLLNRTMLDVRGSGSFVAHDYSDHVLVVTATGSQQGDLQQWRGNSSSSSSPYARFTNVGDLVVNTNATFGDSSSDTVTFYGGVTSDFVPYYNSSYNVGNSSNWWYSGYFNGMNVYNQANVGSLAISSISGCNSGYHLATDWSGNVYCEYSSGGSSSSGYFYITDGSSYEYVYDYEGVTFSDGQNINVSVSSTDTVTIGTTDDVSFVNMNVGGNTTLGDSSSDSVTFGAMIASSLLPWSNVTYDLGNTSARWNTGYFGSLDVSGNVGIGTSSPDYKLDVNGAMIAAPPSVQTIGSNGTIAADACGTVKMISASSNVTTNTTNTFTAPSSANAGCVMHVVNVGSTWIVTLDANTNFKTPSGVNVTLSPNYAVTVVSTGSTWYVMASPSANF